MSLEWSYVFGDKYPNGGMVKFGPAPQRGFYLKAVNTTLREAW